MARARASVRDARPCTRSASAMCAPTRITGLSAAIGSWKTKPIPAPRTCRMSSSGSVSRSRPWKMTRPAVTRPGGCTRRMIENAVTDLPLPDSPTRPSVSPWRDRKRHVVHRRQRSGGVSKRRGQVLRPTAARSDIQARFAILAEHAAQRVGDLADGGAGLDRRDDRRHEVVAARGGRPDGVERRPPGRAGRGRCRTARTRATCCRSISGSSWNTSTRAVRRSGSDSRRRPPQSPASTATCAL